jgi:hypothetical protein
VSRDLGQPRPSAPVRLPVQRHYLSDEDVPVARLEGNTRHARVAFFARALILAGAS